MIEAMTHGTEIAQPHFASDDARWRALCDRDAAADGAFFYSVRTTGVYCRPVLRGAPAAVARTSRFHATAATPRERAGFRPCKRCRPDEPPRAERQAAAVAKACRHDRDAPRAMPSLDALAEAARDEPLPLPPRLQGA